MPAKYTYSGYVRGWPGCLDRLLCKQEVRGSIPLGSTLRPASIAGLEHVPSAPPREAPATPGAAMLENTHPGHKLTRPRMTEEHTRAADGPDRVPRGAENPRMHPMEQPHA